MPADRVRSAFRGDPVNNRRKLVVALGASALAFPLTPYAQPAKVHPRGEECDDDDSYRLRNQRRVDRVIE